MSDPCFCHLNGFAVKDATARRQIAEESAARERAIAAESAARAQAIAEESAARAQAIAGEAEARNRAILDVNEKIDKNNAVTDIVLVTDSYGIPGVSGSVTWQQYVEQFLQNKNVRSYYKGGCGFGWGNTNDYYFPKFFETFQASETVKTVLILAGANDGNLLQISQASESSILSGISEGAAVLRNKFPNADIKLGFVGRFKTPDRYTYYAEARNIYQMCGQFGIGFAPNFEYILHDLNTIEDSDIHPNDTGALLIGRAAASYLLSGSNEVHYKDFTLNGGADPMSYYTEVNNGVTTLYAYPVGAAKNGVYVKSAGVFTEGSSEELYTVNLAHYNPDRSWTKLVSVVCPLLNNSNQRVAVANCRVLILNGKLKVVIDDIISGTAEAASKIGIPPFTIVTDSMLC